MKVISCYHSAFCRGIFKLFSGPRLLSAHLLVHLVVLNEEEPASRHSVCFCTWQTCHCKLIWVEKMNHAGINMLIEWELHLQMCSTVWWSVYAPVKRHLVAGVAALELSATAAQLELLCASFPHLCWRKDNLTVENYTEIPSKRWGFWQYHSHIPLTGFPFPAGKDKLNNCSVFALLLRRKHRKKPGILKSVILRSSLSNEKGRYLSMMLPSCIYRDLNAYI